MSKPIIDTHIHIWDLARANYPWLEGDNSILNRTWCIEELEEARVEAGVVSGVLVQAASNFEDTNLMLETARKTSWIGGVVAWLPLMDPKASQQILEEKFLQEEYFKGARHQVHDEKDTKWLLQAPVIESLALLAQNDIPYDVVGILPAHLETILEVQKRVPGLQMVLDHLNWPPIPQKERFGRWGDLIKEAAKHPNIHAKISGLGTASGNFTGRKPSDIKPYIEFVIEHFGVDRCFCGGDWPVSLLANSYVETWRITEDILQEILVEDQLEKVLYSNAINFYQLRIANTAACR